MTNLYWHLKNKHPIIYNKLDDGTTAIITDLPLFDTAKKEILLKMVQKNARLGFCEVQIS